MSSERDRRQAADDARLLAASSPAGMAHVCSGGQWVPYEHLIMLNDHLLQLVAGEIDRLIVTMPPQHGKSELISKWFPAWYLGTFPDEKVLFGSYQARYASSWGRKAREVLHEFGPWLWNVDVADDPRAAEWWFTDRGGYMASDGAGGSFTGKGAHLMIVDDPIKGHEDAQSDVMREKVWDWWVATLSSRLQQKNAVVVVQTRWHEDDLAGRLLDREAGEWTLLNLPAIAEDGDQLGRLEGEPLCPELHNAEKLERQKRKGAYWWAALYQQRPAPAEGLLFKRKHFRRWRAVEETTGGSTAKFYVLDLDGDDTFRIDAGRCAHFQTADVAASDKTTADYTVVSTWAVTPGPHRRLILIDTERQHFDALEVAAFLMRKSDEHGRPPMWFEQLGVGAVPLKTMRRKGYPVMALTPEHGSQLEKIARAWPAVAAYESHEIFHPYDASWLGEFEHELVSFPNAKNDDQVDTVSYAARLMHSVSAGAKKPQDRERQHTVTRGIMREQF